MTGREKMAAGAAGVLTMGITGYSVWKLLMTGVLSWHIRQPETISMITELLVVWLLLFLFFFMENRNGAAGRIISRCGIAVVVLVFCWLHEMLLPAAVSGIYTGYLVLTGRWFARSFLRKRFDVCWDFLLGSAVTMTAFCLLSLIGMGSIRNLRFWVAASGLLLAVWGVKVRSAEQKNRHSGCGTGESAWSTESAGHAVMLAAILTLVLLQAGRMNLAVDFDSIWYGVRSDVMLNSGNGIYENLGTLGVVYTYSKGFETLCLPLAGLPSYSFPIAMNLWVAGMVLAAGYSTARVVLSRRQALWVPFLMASLPGIMNMADTAKADLMTVFCQLLMVQGMFRYIRERRADWLVAGMAAGGVSLTLKPTAVVFSPAIVGMSVLWILWSVIRDRKQKETFVIKNRRIWLMLVPPAAALIGIWGRTIRLVGVPVTSVFYGLFQKLGFQVKYPFYASGFPSAGSGQSPGESLQFLASRLYGVLFNPQGGDMAHVIIAWGTVLPVVLLILWVFLRKWGRSDAAGPIRTYLVWLLIPLAVVNLISLYSLSQIDGNYYMLYYALIILTGVIWMESLSEKLRAAAKTLLIPVWCYAAVLCCVTNWAWALGNGGLQPVNRGYYPHVEMERQKRAEQGSQAIWDMLAADPKNRVIALGEHPGVLTFPCWVQSYVDVSGYWGNPEVVADAPSFLAYLQFADVDYLYMEKEYVDTSVRIYQIVRSLVETGWLYDVRDENGNLILRVRKEAESGEAASLAVEQNLRVFDERYIQHP